MSFREKYFSDYRAETTLHPNGRGYKVEYVYCGDWYCWDLAKPDFLRFKGAMLLLCGAELVGICNLCAAICASQHVAYCCSGRFAGDHCTDFSVDWSCAALPEPPQGQGPRLPRDMGKAAWQLLPVRGAAGGCRLWLPFAARLAAGCRVRDGCVAGLCDVSQNQGAYIFSVARRRKHFY